MRITRAPEFYQSLIEGISCVGSTVSWESVRHWEWQSSGAQRGSLFLAFKGQHCDAFDFASQVLAQGCRVIVARPEHKETALLWLASYPEAFFILEDPLSFLMRAAAQVLAAMPHLLKIGITGSNGKTTTKEILASVLRASRKPFYASEGNYNSDIGMGLSILQLQGSEEVAIFEMGVNQTGDMDNLVDLLRPQMAVITSLTQAHVDGLGGLEGVIQEKSKIARYAQILFCSEKDKEVVLRASHFTGQVVSFPSKGDLGSTQTNPTGQTFLWQGQEFFLSPLGEGVLSGALTTLAIGEFLGFSYSDYKIGFQAVKLPSGRMQLIQTTSGVAFLNDAYNANLSSLIALLDFLKANNGFFSKYCRTFFVFAGFKELGGEAKEAHQKAVEAIAVLSWNTIFLVGEELREISDRLGSSCAMQYFKDSASALNFFKGFFKAQDFVVLKGARFAALEKVIDLFETEEGK